MDKLKITASPNEQQATVQITGMTCSACAARIEKGLSRMEGVSRANVNLALEQATVGFDPSVSGLPQIEDKIRALGYDTVKETADFDISGMTCAACSARIEKVLSRTPGIAAVNVNLALETAHVEYTPGNISPREIMEKVSNIGYKATLKEDRKDHVDRRVQDIQHKKWKWIISAILSFPLLWAMAGHFSFTSWIPTPELFMNPWFQLVLATPYSLSSVGSST